MIEILEPYLDATMKNKIIYPVKIEKKYINFIFITMFHKYWN